MNIYIYRERDRRKRADTTSRRQSGAYSPIHMRGPDHVGETARQINDQAAPAAHQLHTAPKTPVVGSDDKDEDEDEDDDDKQ